MTTVPEYVTKSELDMRLNVITERQTQEAERNAERYSSMESLLDSKLTMMQLMMEKNFAQYQAIVSAMRAEIREFCSDVKSELSAMRAEGSGLLGDIHALSAQMEIFETKMVRYLSFLGIWLTMVMVLLKLLLK